MHNFASRIKQNCFEQGINQIAKNQIAGHTKFAPYLVCALSLIKKYYKVNFISSIYELAGMVEASSLTGVNKAQLVGTHDCRVIVPVYDWALFL